MTESQFHYRKNFHKAKLGEVFWSSYCLQTRKIKAFIENLKDTVKMFIIPDSNLNEIP